MYHQAGTSHQGALPLGWECALDSATCRWYYFHRASGQTSWVAPTSTPQNVSDQPQHDANGADAGPTTAPTTSTSAAAHLAAPGKPQDPAAAAAVSSHTGATPASASTVSGGPGRADGAAGGAGVNGTGSKGTGATGAKGGAGGVAASSGGKDGWYYRDRSGALHGPFHRDHLSAWRSFLPMDLLVWYVELQPAPPQQHQKPQQRVPDRALPEQQAELQPEQQQKPEAPVAVRVGGELDKGDTPAGRRSPKVPHGTVEPTCPLKALGAYGAEAEVVSEEEGADEGDGAEVRAAKRARRETALEVSSRSPTAEVAQEAPDVERAEAAATASTMEIRAAAVATAEAAAADSVSTFAVAAGSARDGSPERRLGSSSPTPAGGADADDSAAGGDDGGGDGDEGGPVGRSAGPTSAEEAIACGLPGIELAELLGDGPLLTDWRRRFPGHRPPGTAPPAPVHDHWLRAAAAAAAAAHAGYGGVPYWAAAAYGGQAGHFAAAGRASGLEEGAARRPRSREESMLEYAEAVLAGLPPDDEAVVLARHAAAAGKTLADVVNFSWAASSALTPSVPYSDGGVGADPDLSYMDATAGAEAAPPPVDEHGVPMSYVRDPRSGRLTAVGAAAGGQSAAKSLYGEYGSWVNPEEIEDYLAQAKRWRKEQLPALWAKKKLKEVREAKAKKAARLAAGGGGV